MSAPSGNQFWKLRSKHGRDYHFATPEQCLKGCEEYFNWVDGHPWYKVEQLKKPYFDPELKKWVTITKIPTARPYTIEGVCRYIGCNSVWFNQFEKSIDEKIGKGKDSFEEKEWERIQDFSQVLTHVREAIYQQKFEGAAVNAFNSNIIVRDLSLKDKTDITSLGKEIKTLLPPQIIINPQSTGVPISENSTGE